MKKAVIVDVDLTLVGETIYDMALARNVEYNAMWHVETLKAEKLEVGVEMVKILHKMGFALVVMTARDEPGRKELKMKLRELGILHMFDKIMMRDSQDNGLPSSYVKGKMIDTCRGKYKFLFAMDDANHELYRERGIKIMDANNWNGK